MGYQDLSVINHYLLKDFSIPKIFDFWDDRNDIHFRVGIGEKEEKLRFSSFSPSIFSFLSFRQSPENSGRQEIFTNHFNTCVNNEKIVIYRLQFAT
ncbi:hypothetical protein CW751_09460 [Brumimicrobium salinarum]|uniref:Uncharacterized protein n=1 Tax=Brumimicrobium salinarum TaxID=2058658 RepID=A0A2I0R2G5_9FLAO|nr:hypothetical protein CW751_09460 [Brumimicrobium salinarum]